MRPLLILPKKKTMRSLEQFERQAYFSSSTTGWMTENCFRYYAITFVAQLSFLRASWPENLRDESVSLFVDGHSSRCDLVANLILWYSMSTLSAFLVTQVTFCKCSTFLSFVSGFRTAEQVHGVTRV